VNKVDVPLDQDLAIVYVLYIILVNIRSCQVSNPLHQSPEAAPPYCESASPLATEPERRLPSSFIMQKHGVMLGMGLPNRKDLQTMFPESVLEHLIFDNP
jgi:hypothetical protein